MILAGVVAEEKVGGGGGVYRTDSFAGSGALGAAWTVISDNGPATDVTRYSGSFGPGGTGGAGDAWACRNDVAFSPDQSSQMTLGAVGTGGSVGLLVRADPSGGASSSYFFRVGISSTVGGVPVRDLWKVVSGAYTLLWTDAVTGAPGDVYVLSIVGTTITLTCNGTTLFSGTDASIATGAPGIIVTSNIAHDARAGSWVGIG